MSTRFFLTDDVRIAGLRPLMPPAILLEELPISERGQALVSETRAAAGRIILGDDDRLLVVVGPCSVHDPAAALAYAEKLQTKAQELSEQLLVIARIYFEKPRTRVGWKGLINDPGLDGSFEINRGLRTARKLLVDLAAMGVPAGTEFLDTITPQFFADLVSWGAIGARTTESQVHRELASGLSMPVGFKNGTDGSVQIAVDAVGAAQNPHHFLSVTKQGISAIVATRGNAHGHVILRGGRDQPNYDAKSVQAALRLVEKGGLPPYLMVDCSHGNSQKSHERQIEVVREVATQIEAPECPIMGVMIESHLEAGRQDLGPLDQLVFGKSITDACIAWEDTVPLLDGLAEAVVKRRQRASDSADRALGA